MIDYMKKKILLIFILMIAIIVFFFTNNKRIEPFKLENKYYESSGYLDLNEKEFNQLIKNKESFLVFIYQDLCIISDDFNKVLDEFLIKYQISIYKFNFSKLENVNLNKKIKYYPSFIIIKEGKIVAYLKADEDNHNKMYKDAVEFEKWLLEYIILE